MTDVVVVVQARMGSTRRPGKVLADLGGQPMLAFMVRRLQRGDLGTLVVATSTHSIDDPVADLATDLGVTVVRGSEADVLSRFADALRAVPAATVVRLTADCPLQDPALVAQAIDHHHAVRADYTSNTLVRTFPVGLDVEVVRSEALLEADREATDPDEREHVTPFVYRRPDRYSLTALRNEETLGDERWTVDSEEDLAWVRQIVGRMAPGPQGWRGILDTVGRHRQPGPTQLHLRPAPESTPAARVWELCKGPAVLGCLRVPVTDGVGVLDARVPEEVYSEALELLHTALRADLQVRELKAR